MEFQRATVHPVQNGCSTAQAPMTNAPNCLVPGEVGVSCDEKLYRAKQSINVRKYRPKIVTGQNGSRQYGTDKRVWAKWYTD